MTRGRYGMARRLREFYALNPDEELRLEDVAVKFDLTPVQLRNLIAYMQKTGEIEVEVIRVVRYLPISATAEGRAT